MLTIFYLLITVAIIIGIIFLWGLGIQMLPWLQHIQVLLKHPWQMLLITLFVTGCILYFYIPFKGDPSGNIISSANIWYTIINIISVTGLGMLALALFTQFNSFDTPIQPLTWPIPSYNPARPKWSIFKILLKVVLSGSLFSYLGYTYGGTNKSIIAPIAGFLGVIAALLLNFANSTRTLSYKMIDNVKVVGKLGIAILLVLGLIWLILNFSVISTSLYMLFGIIIGAGLLFLVFHFLYNNPIFRKFLRSSILVRMFFYLIFAIPCLIASIFKDFTMEFGKTPRYVYMILLVEAVVLALYFAVPIFIRRLYLSRPYGSLSGRKSDIDTRLSTLYGSVTKQRAKIYNLKSVIAGMTWNEIWLPKSGVPISANQRQVMRDKLSTLGYTDSGGDCPPTVDNTYYNSFKKKIGLIPRCSIGKAIDYIIKTQPIILNEEKKLLQLTDDLKDLKTESEQFYKIFDTKMLIDKPISTNKLLTKKTWHYTNLKKGKSYNYVYTLSSWIYIKQGASNSNFKNNLYTSLINYGDKPNILYKYDNNTLRVTVQTEKEASKIIYETTNFSLQKWNYIVINFSGGTLDVFINNQLVATEKNVIPYILTDAISIGENNGVNGKICNTVYYPDTLGRTKMELFYNTLKLKNPPTI